MTRLFSVTGAAAQPATPLTFSDAGLQERAHLQEWIIAHPEVLGDVMVITSEYDKWAGADGTQAKERLDILALESSGRLVVSELKRDGSGTSVHIQAITYAALCSRFTAETLADAYVAFRAQRGETVTSADAVDRLLEHIGGEWDPEMLRRPRIVLVAGTFPAQVTHSAVWLNEMGVSMTLLQANLWQVGATVIAGFTQLYPTPELEEFTLAPTAAASVAAEKKAKANIKAAAAVSRIIAGNLLTDGTDLVLAPTHGTNPQQRADIAAWVAEDPARGRATWANTKVGPIVWEADGKGWQPTTLARHILMEACGDTSAIRGPAWWLTPTGETLAELADGLPGGNGSYDWSTLHRVLAAVPAGRWTTYGDLAEVVGTAPQPVGNHVTKCPDCPNAWRILNVHGKPAPGFRWTDPTDTRTQEQALLAEGVTFVDGAASTGKMTTAELATGT